MNDVLINRILVATDFSECARRAVEYGVYVARAWSAHVDLLYVVEVLRGLEFDAPFADPLLEGRRKEAVRLLGDQATRVKREGLGVDWHLREGIPSEQIGQAALEQRADLVVVGTHGRTGLDHIMLGSTAERVIKQAPCPVLTVRVARIHEEKDVDVPPCIRHLLVPVDFSSPSLDALEYAIQVVDRFGARLTLLHVLEPIYYDLELGLGRIEQEVQKRTHWEAQLDGLAQVVRERGLAAESVVLGGIPSESIVTYAREQCCDLIVMGTHGRRGLTRLRYGSVAESVLRQAPCPVLTVKSPKFEPGHRRILPQAVK
ncbi:MAG: Universal stress protein family [Nitrospira sp.]|jgi:nucleotide-binding universal stress UspA family protein|nr:MAG: Universal stress protein family [Nitrospira sp.]